MYRLSFDSVHSYADRDSSVTVPVLLRSGAKKVELVASIDTGASYCLFEGGYATELGIELASGVPTRFRTANSNFEAYGHEVEIRVLGVTVQSLVYFFADPAIRKNVLGRRGWLDRVRLGIIDYDWDLFLASYDSDLI